MSYIPNSRHDDYHGWLTLGMALHYETDGCPEGMQISNQWSSTSPKYKGQSEILAKWASFGKNNGRSKTGRTIIKLAIQYGFKFKMPYDAILHGESIGRLRDKQADTLQTITGYLLAFQHPRNVVHDIIQAVNTCHCEPPRLREEVTQLVKVSAEREEQKLQNCYAAKTGLAAGRRFFRDGDHIGVLHDWHRLDVLKTIGFHLLADNVSHNLVHDIIQAMNACPLCAALRARGHRAPRKCHG